MARLPRFALPGQPQHVIQRGNNRQVCFCDPSDYRFYLDKLRAASAKHACEIHAYVLMTNHVHLLVTPRCEGTIGKMMQTLGRYYFQYYKYCYKRTGTLWEGRYKATLIDSEPYLLTCMRYIELNPVRANQMAEHPDQYPWTSYRHNALGREDPSVTPHRVYQRLGKTGEQRQAAYRQLFRAGIPEKTLEEIRHATNKARALGNDRFKRRIEAQLKRQIEPKARGGDRKPVKPRINRV
jgi:REP-associated tyrosine transposase